MKRFILTAIFLLFLVLFSTNSVSARLIGVLETCNPDEIGTPITLPDGTSMTDCEPKPVTPPPAAAIPTIGTVDKTKIPAISLNDLIKNGVNISIALTGVIFFFMLIFGGIKYLTSGGDEKAAASARGTLTNAFIGLVIVVAAFLVAQLLFTIFGLQGVSVSSP